jgi:hypothetical protein
MTQKPLSRRAQRLLAIIHDPAFVEKQRASFGGDWMALPHAGNFGGKTFAELVNAGIIEERYPEHRHRAWGSYWYRLRKPELFDEDFGDLWIAAE